MKRTVFVGTIVLTALSMHALGAEESVSSRTVAAEAYDLRMRGKMDEAVEILERSIETNPDNAAAHYELARSQYHKALGRPQELSGLMRTAQESIDRAVALDPDDAMCRVFAGHTATILGYMEMLKHESAAKEQYAKACEAYDTAIGLNPGSREGTLYLVELYGTLPEGAGGDKAKAKEYAERLEEIDKVFGAKARSLLLEGDADKVAYWKAFLGKHEGNAEALEELGDAYLSEGKVDKAVACFEEAIAIDAKKSLLFLDLTKYHTFAAMGARDDPESFEKSVASGAAAVARYLESNPVQPMRAYALGVQSKFKSHSGDKEQGRELFRQAESLDPYFSKATGLPHPDLFVPPGEVSREHRYLMR